MTRPASESPHWQFMFVRRPGFAAGSSTSDSRSPGPGPGGPTRPGPATAYTSESRAPQSRWGVAAAATPRAPHDAAGRPLQSQPESQAVLLSHVNCLGVHPGLGPGAGPGWPRVPSPALTHLNMLQCWRQRCEARCFSIRVDVLGLVHGSAGAGNWRALFFKSAPQ
jgi:hypothetical protein